MIPLLGAESPSVVELAQYGVLGLVVLAFISGLIWPRPSVDRIIRDYDRVSGLLEAQTKMIQERELPLLQRAATALENVEARERRRESGMP